MRVILPTVAVLMLVPATMCVAQTAAPDTVATIDLHYWKDLGVLILSAVISALGVAAFKWLQSLTGIRVEEGHRDALYKAIENGISLALQKGMDIVPSTLSVDVKSELAATVIERTARVVPDALKGLGIDPSTADGERKLIELIIARVPFVVKETTEPVPTPDPMSSIYRPPAA